MKNWVGEKWKNLRTVHFRLWKLELSPLVGRSLVYRRLNWTAETAQEVGWWSTGTRWNEQRHRFDFVLLAIGQWLGFAVVLLDVACFSSEMATVTNILGRRFYRPTWKQLTCQISFSFFKNSARSELFLWKIMSHFDSSVLRHWDKQRVSCCAQVKRTTHTYCWIQKTSLAIHVYLLWDHRNTGLDDAFLFLKCILVLCSIL